MTVEHSTTVVVVYHFLRCSNFGQFKLRAHETPDRFRAQVSQIANRFPVCGTRELLDPNRDLAGPQVVIHFDDGASDVLREALSVLGEYGVTATVFVCSRPYLEGRLLSIQKIEYLIRRLGLDGLRKAFYTELTRRFSDDVARESLDFAKGYHFYRYDEPPMREFKLDLNYRIPYANIDPVLDSLFDGTFGDGAEAAAVKETYLSLDDLKRLLDAGIEIGVHTHRHRVLPRLDLDTQASEIGIGLEFVRLISGVDDPSVSYPFGFSDDRTALAMSELGARAGFSIERRAIGPDDIAAKWTIPRFDVNDCFSRDSNEMVPRVFDPLERARAD